MHKTSSHRNISLFATIALGLTIPFNMGGCADVTGPIGGKFGGAFGGSQGANLVDTGVKIVKNESISEKDERTMGESVAMAVTTKYPVVKNEKLNRYVALIGLTLANASSRPDGNWLFAVVDTNEVNAFSGPDGYILITRGLIAQLHDEAELAGVLAHEMSHVLDQHGMQAVKQAGRANILASALSQADQRFKAFSEATDGLVDAVLVKGYGRDQEDEADADAVKLLLATGYDPTSYLHFIERMAGQQHGNSSIMSTHPGAADRAERIRGQIAALKPLKPGAVVRERFEASSR